MGYRNILDCVRIEVPVKRYEIEHLVDGDIPEWLAQRLPLFGSEDGEETYTNSCGRGILIEGNEGVYRIKCVDPKGVITRLVADSDKNIISDIRQSVSVCPNPKHIEKMLTVRKNHHLPAYKEDRPFNFLEKEAVERSRHVFGIMGEEYERYGFSYPCAYRGYIAYKNLRWNDWPTRSIIFQLPDAESDLREDELSVTMRRYLQHASVEQLRGIGDRFIDFYRKLLKWHAFDCRILVEHQLLPTPESMIGQNHLIAHVSDGKVGLVRIDHTSTKKVDLDEKELFKRMTFRGGISMFISNIPLALEMADRGVRYDTDRYSNYYDAAFKFHNVDYNDWPKTLDFLRGTTTEFEDAYKSEPEPIDESELTGLFDDVTSIEIDREFEARRAEMYEKIRALNRQKGITMSKLLQMVNDPEFRRKMDSGIQSP